MTHFHKARFVLLVATLGAATYAGYRAQARRAATLDRITALAGCLAARNQQRAQAAAGIVRYLSNRIRSTNSRLADIAVLREAQQVEARTKGLVDTLHQVRRQWRAHGRAELSTLPAQLGSYCQFIRRYYPAAVPLVQQSSYQAPSTGWLGQFDLPAEPLPVALATLTLLEAQVQDYQANSLASEAAKMGPYCFVIDKIGGWAIAASQSVIPGAVYEARLLLSPAAPYLYRPIHMAADGHSVRIDPKTNHGLVRFQLPAARPGQPDTVRATWQGLIWWEKNGRDTVLQVTVPYLIVKRPAP